MKIILHALFQPLSLGVLLVALAVTLSVVLIGQVHDNLLIEYHNKTLITPKLPSTFRKC